MTTRAVFIGASNVIVGTWPEKLSKAEGWVSHNYARSSTYFNETDMSFLIQLQKAIDDPSFSNSEVKYVFVAGGGNDIRSYNSVKYSAWKFHGLADNAFPNARIISIPALWNDNGIHSFLPQVASEMRLASLGHGHEVIWQAWTWLLGHPEWMDGVVHPNALGYDQFVKHIRSYLRGDSVTVEYPNTYTLPSGVKAHSRGTVRCICINGIVYLTARLEKEGGFKFGETVMILPPWAAASQGSNPRPIAGGLNAMDRHAGFYVYSDGRVTLRSAEDISTEINIAEASWPIGM